MKNHIHQNTIFTFAKYILLGLLITVATTNVGLAQSEVTFKVNLKPQLEDSVFIPGRDQIYLQGNVYPLSSGQKTDHAPADSVYEVSVRFPSRVVGQQLSYNFFIDTPQNTKEEQMPRNLQIRSRDQELDALYFDSFAW